MKKRTAFTLIELLVVIAILSLLVSILLPSLTRAKEIARGMLCLSNHHQLLLGIHLYVEDHDQQAPYPQTSFPSPYTWDGKTYDRGANPINVLWYHAPFVGRYIGNQEVESGSTNALIYCPSVVNYSKMATMRPPDSTTNRNGIGINHTSSCYLYHDKPPTNPPWVLEHKNNPFYEIRTPSRMVILADSAYSGYKQGYYAWGYITRDVDGVPEEAGGVVRTTSYGTTAYRHIMLCNLSFADGHAEAYPDVVTAIQNKMITANARQ